MEDTLTINGIEYVRKDSIKKNDYAVLKEDINKMLDATHKEINTLIDSYMSNETGLDTTIRQNSQILTEMDRNAIVEIFPSEQQLYKDVAVYADGSVRISGRKSKLNINDINYIKENINDGCTTKDITKMSKKLKIAVSTLHRIIFNIVNGVFDFDNIPVIEDKPKKQPKTIPKMKKTSVYKRGTDIFDVNPSAKQVYSIDGMDKTGNFFINGCSNFNLNIHQVLKVKTRVCTKKITMNRARQIASDIGLSFYVMMRVAYNISIGYFDKYIEEWTNRCHQASPSYKRKERLFQNNPEKRIEQGYYNGAIGY